MSRKTSGDGWSFVPAGGGEEAASEPQILALSAHQLKVGLEKRAKGKIVTVVSGFSVEVALLQKTGKKLKAACGTGGTAKNGQIELQGEHVERARAWLEANGWGLRA